MLLPAIRCGQAIDCPSTRLLRRPARIAWCRFARLWICPGAWRALVEPQSCPPRPHLVFPHWRHNPPWHPAYRRFRPILRPRSGPEPTNNDPLVIHLSQGATCVFLEMSNPSTGGIQAQWPSLPGLDSSPGCCPHPHLLHGDLTGAAGLHSPWFNPSGPTGWHKVLQVFVPGGSARETNLQIFA